MRILAAMLLAALPLAAGDEDPTDILMRLRDQVVAHGERIPNHTCVETVVRDRYEPTVSPIPKSCDSLLARRKQSDFPALVRLATTDRLRLDVALAESGGEMYSWAGASKFEEGDIDELIPDGAMGTGLYAALLIGVFRGRSPKFVYNGETTLDHRLAFEYSFHVPLEESHYRVKTHEQWLTTGYGGTLWADAQSAELLRLNVHTDELPTASGLCETDTSLDYGMVQLGKDFYLLPSSTRQRFIQRTGGEAENNIAFSACREYRGESTVSFGERRAGVERAENKPPALELPLKLPVSIELIGAIQCDRAAAGDRIQARLAKPIRDSSGAVLVAQGAALEGRLMRVETRHGHSPDTVVAIRWESLDVDGTKIVPSLLPKRKIADLKIGERVGLLTRGDVIELPYPSDIRYGVYHFPGEHPVIESGFLMEWTTVRP
jgi:hypothetical protein